MKARFDSELLRTFVSIAETGSFTRAADLVGRTQSAVSMQVKRLEDVAGATLFVRNARGVALTPLGESLLTDARRIIRLLDQAAEALHPNALEGAVSVGIPEEYGTTILPQILARFAETHARVEVTVTCEPSLALQAALERGDLDLAVTVVDDGRTQGEILLHDPTVWVTSSRHLAHEQDPLPVAMFARGCWWRDWALEGPGRPALALSHCLLQRQRRRGAGGRQIGTGRRRPRTQHDTRGHPNAGHAGRLCQPAGLQRRAAPATACGRTAGSRHGGGNPRRLPRRPPA